MTKKDQKGAKYESMLSMFLFRRQTLAKVHNCSLSLCILLGKKVSFSMAECGEVLEQTEMTDKVIFVIE